MFFSRTLFCSLRPQVLTEIGSVLFDRRSQRNSLPFPSTARSQRNSVPFPSSAIIRTRFCSPERPVLNGTQFRSRAAASQRNSVLFTDSCITTELSSVLLGSCISTELGSVPLGQLHPNGTQFCSPRAAGSQRNSVP